METEIGSLLEHVAADKGQTKKSYGRDLPFDCFCPLVDQICFDRFCSILIFLFNNANAIVNVLCSTRFFFRVIVCPFYTIGSMFHASQ